MKKSVPPHSLLQEIEDANKSGNRPDAVLLRLVGDMAKDGWSKLATICDVDLYEEVAYECYLIARFWIGVEPSDFAPAIPRKDAQALAKSLRLLASKLEERGANQNLVNLLSRAEKQSILDDRQGAVINAYRDGMEWETEAQRHEEAKLAAKAFREKRKFKLSESGPDPHAADKEKALEIWKKPLRLDLPFPDEWEAPDRWAGLLPNNLSLAALMVRHAASLDLYADQTKRTYRHEDELRTRVIRALHSSMMVHFDRPYYAIVCSLAVAILNDPNISEDTVRGAVRSTKYPYISGTKIRWHKSNNN